MLFSADIPLAPLADAVADGSAVRTVLIQDWQSGARESVHGVLASQAAAGVSRELAFVDASLHDAGALISELSAMNSSQRHIEVILLRQDEDGIARISEVLAQRSRTDAVHLLTHGAGGHVRVGATVLDQRTLQSHAAQVQGWGAALSAQADIFLYGCDVAGNAEGRSLVRALAQMTGADVAASDDLTGGAGVGADWDLEIVEGVVDGSRTLGQTTPVTWSGTLSDQFQVNVTTTSDQSTAALQRGSAQAVAVDANGNFVVVWTSQNQDGHQGGVFARCFAANGAALTGEIQVNQTTANDQKWASVASDAAGNFVVTWTSRVEGGDQGDIYVRRFDPGGSALTAETRVNTTVTSSTQQNSTLAVDASGDFVVVWEGVGSGDADGVFFRRYNADGTAKDASEQSANSVDAGDEKNAAVAAAPGGSFVVVWERGSRVFFQRFSSAGTAQSAVTQADSGLSSVAGPAVAMNAAGEFTVMYRVADTLTGVWGRGFLADGTQKYGFFQADTGDATDPSIAMATDGAFIVVYERSTDGDGRGVYARRYLADGSADGSAFLVNQYITGQQHEASVALVNINNSVMVWSGGGAADSTGVHARQYSGTNTAPVNSVPAAQSMAEDETLVFSAGNGNLISISDADVGSGNLQVTLSVTYGVITLGGTAGLTFSVGDGSGDTSMVFTGTRAQINAALAGLQFTPTADYAGGAGLQIDTDDLGNSGFGGSLIDTDTVSITVTAVDDAPVAVGDSATVLQGQTLAVSAGSGLLGNDIDTEGDTLAVLAASDTAQGTLSVAADGSFGYTPTPSYAGADAFSYLVRDTSDGRTHYWGLAGNASDAIGGISGTISGAATVSGQFGSALAFDGVDDHVDISDFTYSDAFTLSFWFKLPSLAGADYQYFYSHGATSAQNSINVYLIEDSGSAPSTDGKLRTELLDGNDAVDLVGLQVDAVALGLGDNAWHLYTLTAQAGTGSRVYIDGVLRASSANGGDTLNPAGSATLGGRGDLDSLRFLTGALDGVQVHDHALASAEIDDILNATSATVSITVTANTAPVITSNGGSPAASLGIAENTLAVSTVSATDPDAPPQSLTYSLSGADQALFAISGGVLRFVASPDFEMPLDADLDNVYVVQITVDDGAGGSAAQTLSITVTDDPEIPPESVSFLPATSSESILDDGPSTAESTPSIRSASEDASSSEASEGTKTLFLAAMAFGGASDMQENSALLGAIVPQEKAALVRRAVAAASTSGATGGWVRPHFLPVVQSEAFALGPGTSAATLSAQALRSSLAGSQWLGHLQFMREQLEEDMRLNAAMIGTTAFVSGGVSVGYVIWLIRGGVLMSTLLSALPAWQGIDPLPVLRQRRDEDGQGDREDVVEGMFDRARRAWLARMARASTGSAGDGGGQAVEAGRSS